MARADLCFRGEEAGGALGAMTSVALDLGQRPDRAGGCPREGARHRMRRATRFSELRRVTRHESVAWANRTAVKPE